MYPIIILRAEVVCIVILVFLFFVSRSYNISCDSKSFGRLLAFALIHVLFDIITVLTVNNTQTVPEWVNWLCHVLFYLSAIFFSSEIAYYSSALCYPRFARKYYMLEHSIATVYIICLSFLKIDYVPDVGTYSSTGPAAYIGYGIAFLFFASALVIMFMNWDKLPLSTKSALVPMLLVLIVTEICQIIWRSLLFTGCAITIVTVGFFFSLENPVEVFKRKAMTDALTGVRSRSSYETDMEAMNKKFSAHPGEDYTFVFCDLNDLRSVNNRFGHSEGDNYITLIVTAISRCMKHAYSVYRIGGDEFLVVYYKTDEKTVVGEIEDLQNNCINSSKNLRYTAQVSVGYAKSSANYKNLNDVVKTADYAMYRDKVSSKARSSDGNNEV